MKKNEINEMAKELAADHPAVKKLRDVPMKKKLSALSKIFSTGRKHYGKLDAFRYFSGRFERTDCGFQDSPVWTYRFRIGGNEEELRKRNGTTSGGDRRTDSAV